jgi:hypothetical protein
MDPNATLRLINDALWAGDDDGMKEGMDSLRGWLLGGGFEPDWSEYPAAAELYHRTWGAGT